MILLFKLLFILIKAYCHRLYIGISVVIKTNVLLPCLVELSADKKQGHNHDLIFIWLILMSHPEPHQA